MFTNNGLAINLQKMIESIDNANLNMNVDCKNYNLATNRNSPFNQFIDNEQQQSNYSMWNNYFETNYSHSSINSSSTSPASISPNSSIETTNNFIQYQKLHSINHPKTRSELPSAKTIVDIGRYQTRTARILEKNPNKIVSCTFCKNNGESHHIYTTHSIKDFNGRVTCPYLKAHICPICGETGQNAHTLAYCKKYKTQKRNDLLQRM